MVTVSQSEWGAHSVLAEHEYEWEQTEGQSLIITPLSAALMSDRDTAIKNKWGKNLGRYRHKVSLIHMSLTRT